MKISERQENFLKALHAAFGGDEVTTRAVSLRISGLSAQVPVNTALLHAIAGCVGRNITSARIGRLLEKICDRRMGDLELVTDGDKRGGVWRYYIKDHSKPAIPMPEMPTPREATSFKEYDQHEKQRERLIKQIERDEDREKAKAAIADAKQAKADEEAEQARKDAQGSPTKLYSRLIRTTAQALEMVKAIHRPQSGVECRMIGEPPRHHNVLILLRGPWDVRKHLYERLTALFHRRGWCSHNERAFDGDITPALLLGKEIPATASQDPSHYGTTRMHEQMANRLAAAGISSNELALEDYIQQQRKWAGWGQEVGGGFHRAPGMHSDFGGTVRLKKFDPLQRPGEPTRGI